MTESNGKAGAPNPVLTPEDMEEIARSIGLIFSNTFLYGVDHGVTTKAIEDGFAVVSIGLERVEELCFDISNDGIIVNGSSVDQKNPLTRMFATHLSSLSINNFSLRCKNWEGI